MSELKEIKRYYVTAALVIVNLVIFVIMDVSGANETNFGLISWGASYYDSIVYDGEWWRLLTACFLHLDVEHIFGNMIALGVFGYRLEEGLGHMRFLIAYLVSGVGASYIALMLDHMLGMDAVSLGASGAISGILGALIAYMIRTQTSLEGVGLPQMAVATVVMLLPSLRDPRVGNIAHMSGLIIGFIGGYLLVKTKQMRYSDMI